MKRTGLTMATLLTASCVLAGVGWATTAALEVADAPPLTPLADQQAAVPQSAFLGVAVAPVDDDTATLLGIHRGTGLVVEHLADAGPASAAGLKVGDVMTQLDDQRLINPQQLAVLVNMHTPGDEVMLHILRQGEPMRVQARLTARAPEHPGAQAADPRDAMRQRMHRDWPELRFIGPDHLDPMFEQLQQQMLQQRAEMDRLMQQIQQQLQRMPEADPLGELPELPRADGDAAMRIHAQSFWQDDEHTLRLKTDGNSKWLKVTTREGAVLFDGAVPDDGVIDGLPEAVEHKVDQMLKSNRVKLKLAPPVKREPKGPIA